MKIESEFRAVFLATDKGLRTTDIEREWLMSELDPFLGLSGAERYDPKQAGSWFITGESDDREEARDRTD